MNQHSAGTPLTTNPTCNVIRAQAGIQSEYLYPDSSFPQCFSDEESMEPVRLIEVLTKTDRSSA